MLVNGTLFKLAKIAHNSTVFMALSIATGTRVLALAESSLPTINPPRLLNLLLLRPKIRKKNADEEDDDEKENDDDKTSLNLFRLQTNSLAKTTQHALEASNASPDSFAAEDAKSKSGKDNKKAGGSKNKAKNTKSKVENTKSDDKNKKNKSNKAENNSVSNISETENASTLLPAQTSGVLFGY